MASTRWQALANNFRHALELFDFASAESGKLTAPSSPGAFPPYPGPALWRFNRWEQIAAREGAFLLYDFRHALRTTISETFKHAGLSQDADRTSSSHANELFERAFPHWYDVRNAVGHTGEIAITSNQLEKNATAR